MRVKVYPSFILISKLDFSKIESLDDSEIYLDDLNVTPPNRSYDGFELKITGAGADLYDLLFFMSDNYDVTLI